MASGCLPARSARVADLSMALPLSRGWPSQRWELILFSRGAKYCSPPRSHAYRQPQRARQQPECHIDRGHRRPARGSTYIQLACRAAVGAGALRLQLYAHTRARASNESENQNHYIFKKTETTHLIKFKNILTSPCTVLTAPGHYMTDNRVMFGLPTVPGATPGASGPVQQPVAPALTVAAARPPAAAAPAAAP
jgi:hypothetical protein